jgi:hypothetical protein
MNDKKFIANFASLSLEDKVDAYNKFAEYMTINMRHVLQRMIGLEFLYRRHTK